MLTIFALPTDFIADINDNATDVITAVSPYLTLVIGVLLAMLVIGFLISSISRH